MDAGKKVTEYEKEREGKKQEAEKMLEKTQMDLV